VFCCDETTQTNDNQKKRVVCVMRCFINSPARAVESNSNKAKQLIHAAASEVSTKETANRKQKLCPHSLNPFVRPSALYCALFRAAAGARVRCL